MTKTTRTSAKVFAATMAIAMATSGVLAVSTPQTAYAATPAKKTTAKATVKHYNGESLVVPTGNGTSVYAEWYKIGKSWKAVFATTNGTKIYGTKSGNSWSFVAVTKKGNVPVIRTKFESTKVGKYGPKHLSSHWRAKSGNVWY